LAVVAVILLAAVVGAYLLLRSLRGHPDEWLAVHPADAVGQPGLRHDRSDE